MLITVLVICYVISDPFPGLPLLGLASQGADPYELHFPSPFANWLGQVQPMGGTEEKLVGGKRPGHFPPP